MKKRFTNKRDIVYRIVRNRYIPQLAPMLELCGIKSGEDVFISEIGEGIYISKSPVVGSLSLEKGKFDSRGRVSYLPFVLRSKKINNGDTVRLSVILNGVYIIKI